MDAGPLRCLCTSLLIWNVLRTSHYTCPRIGFPYYTYGRVSCRRPSIGLLAKALSSRLWGMSADKLLPGLQVIGEKLLDQLNHTISMVAPGCIVSLLFERREGVSDGHREDRKSTRLNSSH